MSQLCEKYVLITGVSQGLGREIAIAFTKVQPELRSWPDKGRR